MSADSTQRVGPDPHPDRAAYTIHETRQQLRDFIQRSESETAASDAA